MHSQEPPLKQPFGAPRRYVFCPEKLVGVCFILDPCARVGFVGKLRSSQVVVVTPLIPVTGRQRQADLQDSQGPVSKK